MTKWKRLSALGLVVLAFGGKAEGGYVVYSDGGYYSLSSATSDHFGVTKGSTFSVLAGASITPTAGAQYGDAAIFGNSGTILVSGGAVTGGSSSPSVYGGGDGIIVIGPAISTTITGGTITGGAGISGGTGFSLLQAGPTTISGGTITGGKGTLFESQGGAAIVYQAGSPLIITGGTFAGGGTTGPVPIPSPSLLDQGLGNIEVSGGQFLSEIVLSASYGVGRLDFFGTGLSYANGLITGTLSNGDSIHQSLIITSVAGETTTVVYDAAKGELSFLSAPTTVPEPASIALIALGLGGASLVARSRRN